MRTLIITGGTANQEFTKEYLKKYSFDLIIAVDKGLEVLDNLNVKPNYIVGDFDSINKKVLEKYKNDDSIKIMTLNPEKDFTDTHVAINIAIENKSKEIIILRSNRHENGPYTCKYKYSKRNIKRKYRM